MQDLGTASGPSNSLVARAASGSATGTASAAARPASPSPTRPIPNIVYAGEYGGIITRYDHRTGQARNVGTYPDNPSGHGAEDSRYRFQWTAPIVDFAARPEGGLPRRQRAVPHRATAGRPGSAISPDLTRNDKSEAEVVRRPDHRRQHRRRVLRHDLRRSPSRRAEAGCSGPAATTAWSTSPATAARPGPTSRRTSRLARVGHGAPASSRRRSTPAPPTSSSTPTAWTTPAVPVEDDRLRQDAGRASPPACPQDVYLHAVREDPTRKGLLYLGTERGVRSRADDGATWQAAEAEPADGRGPRPGGQGQRSGGRHQRPLDLDPRRPHAGPRVVGRRSRRGRSTSSRPVRRRAGGFAAAMGRDEAAADNPPAGATVHYWLKEKPKGERDDRDAGREGRRRPAPHQPEGGAGDGEGRPGPARRRGPAEAAAGRGGRAAGSVGPALGRRRDPIKGAKIDSGEPGRGARASSRARTR